MKNFFNNGGVVKLMAHPGIRWAAVSLLLVAYVLVSHGIVAGQGVIYNGINAIGSILLIANSLSAMPKDWAIAIFNMVWLGIAIVTVIAFLMH